MSNTERQRLFRQRHPGYYGRLHRRRKSSLTTADAMREKTRLLEAAYAKLMQQPQLALPAPAETIEIPGANAIPTTEAFEAAQVEQKAALAQ